MKIPLAALATYLRVRRERLRALALQLGWQRGGLDRSQVKELMRTIRAKQGSRRS